MNRPPTRPVCAVLGLVLLLFGPALAGLTTAEASGPMESFVLVEKVTFEPNDEKPERVRIEGAFAVADGKNWRYLGARWGVAVRPRESDAPSPRPRPVPDPPHRREARRPATRRASPPGRRRRCGCRSPARSIRPARDSCRPACPSRPRRLCGAFGRRGAS